jgi:peptidyl-prolyl cis-trans isomerase B (cyclophilin B)
MQAIIHTTAGDIHVTLFPKTAPKTVANFVKLAKAGYYDQLAFHRVVANFVIQGGCPNTREGSEGRPGAGNPGYHIPCEVGPSNPEKHLPGTLSMAHAGRDTGGSQFFLTHRATPHLDNNHTVFGRIVSEADLAVINAVKVGDRFSIEIID